MDIQKSTVSETTGFIETKGGIDQGTNDCIDRDSIIEKTGF